MSLTVEQRDELEALGPDLVRQKLLDAGVARGAAVAGFKTARYLLRGDIEDWLVEQHSAGTTVQRYTLWAAIIAAGVGIASLGVAVATLWYTIWPRH